MIVEVDENSGFCFGVVNAIERVEEELKTGSVYCVGDIVHNSMEVERLKSMGLITIDRSELKNLHNARVVFRAHGEPPTSYQIAHKNNMEIIDASCPVVLRLQKMIRQAYDVVKNRNGKIVIFGEPGHAEVVGLVGQTDGNAVVIENLSDIDGLDFSKPIDLFSQTTKSLTMFRLIANEIQKRGGELVTVHDTICRKVERRVELLKKFASEHDLIVFVAGAKSSNGKQLFAVCKEANPNSILISEEMDLNMELLCGAKSVGISGATSTPRSILDKLKNKIINS